MEINQDIDSRSGVGIPNLVIDPSLVVDADQCKEEMPANVQGCQGPCIPGKQERHFLFLDIYFIKLDSYNPHPDMPSYLPHKRLTQLSIPSLKYRYYEQGLWLCREETVCMNRQDDRFLNTLFLFTFPFRHCTVHCIPVLTGG